MEESRNNCPSMYSLSTTRVAHSPFCLRCLRMGYSALRLSVISFGNWSFIPNVVPFSYLPLLFSSSFCWKCSNFAMMEQGRDPVLAPRRCMRWCVFINNVWREFESGLHEAANECVGVICRAFRDSWEDEVVSHALCLNVQNGFFQGLIFLFYHVIQVKGSDGSGVDVL